MFTENPVSILQTKEPSPMRLNLCSETELFVLKSNSSVSLLQMWSHGPSAWFKHSHHHSLLLRKMLSYFSPLRQAQTMYLMARINPAHQWILDCLCIPQWSFHCALPLTLTLLTYFYHIFMQDFSHWDDSALWRQKLNCLLYLKISPSIYIEQFLEFPWLHQLIYSEG